MLSRILSIAVLFVAMTACDTGPQGKSSAAVPTSEIIGYYDFFYDHEEGELNMALRIVQSRINDYGHLVEIGLYTDGGDSFTEKNVTQNSLELGNFLRLSVNLVLATFDNYTKIAFVQPGDELQIGLKRGNATFADSYTFVTVPQPPILTPNNISGQTFQPGDTLTVNWDQVVDSELEVYIKIGCAIPSKPFAKWDKTYTVTDTGSISIPFSELSVPFSSCLGEIIGNLDVARVSTASTDNGEIQNAAIEIQSREQDKYNFYIAHPNL